MDGDGELLLGLVLADDVLVEEFDDLAGSHGGRLYSRRVADVSREIKCRRTTAHH
jgi:hypothetical protein